MAAIPDISLNVHIRPVIEASLVEAICKAMDVPLLDTTRIEITPSACLIEYLLTDEDGKKYLAGDDVARGSKTFGIQWSTS